MSDAIREHVHEAMQKMIDIDPPKEGDEDYVLRSWAVVATLSYADGGNQMYRLSGNAVGEQLAKWEADGLLHYALYDWESDDE